MKTALHALVTAVVLSACPWALAATITVTSTADSGAGTLRAALMSANAGDTIQFSVTGVITLTSGELVIDEDITISGPGWNFLSVSRDQGAAAFRIFHIVPGHEVAMGGLAIRNGFATGSGSSANGGGIFNDHSTLTVNNCLLGGNSAGSGGGIHNDGSNSGSATVTIINSTFAGNSANFGGGIFNNAGPSGTATLTIVNCTLSGNSAANMGGAIFNEDDLNGNGTVKINNSTLSGNTAVNTGGAILNDGSGGLGSVMIANSTLSGNTAGGSSVAGTVFNQSARLEIGNTVFKAAQGPNIGITGASVVTSRGYNLSSDDGGGFLTATGDQINTDPMLGPLKDNGGLTLTHAPLIDSPGIDKGKRNTIPALTTNIDQRGFPRPVTDPVVPCAVGGDCSDIGAVELAVGIHPTSAASRKTHGGAGDFDLDLPLTGPFGIECRSGGGTNDYRIVFNFAANTTFSGAAVVSGNGTVSSTSGSGGMHAIVNLTGVANAQILTLALFDANDGTHSGDIGLRFGVLVADVNGNGTVNAADLSLTKSHIGEPILQSNFRADVNANGDINASDAALVKSRLGTSLPP